MWEESGAVKHTHRSGLALIAFCIHRVGYVLGGELSYLFCWAVDD